MYVMPMKSILSFEKKSPNTRPHIIKGVMDNVLEIEPVVSFLFHG